MISERNEDNWAWVIMVMVGGRVVLRKVECWFEGFPDVLTHPSNDFGRVYRKARGCPAAVRLRQLSAPGVWLLRLLLLSRCQCHACPEEEAKRKEKKGS